MFYHLCLTLWHWYFIKGGRDRNCLYSPRIVLPPKYFNRNFNFNYCLFKQVGFNSFAKFLIQVDNRYNWKWTMMVNIQVNLIWLDPNHKYHRHTRIPIHILLSGQYIRRFFPWCREELIVFYCPRLLATGKTTHWAVPCTSWNTPVLWSIDCSGLYYCTNMVCIVITFGELLYSIVTNEHRRVSSPQGHVDQLFII